MGASGVAGQGIIGQGRVCKAVEPKILEREVLAAVYDTQIYSLLQVPKQVVK
jgi:hypothetical protein